MGLEFNMKWKIDSCYTIFIIARLYAEKTYISETNRYNNLCKKSLSAEDLENHLILWSTAFLSISMSFEFTMSKTFVKK